METPGAVFTGTSQAAQGHKYAKRVKGFVGVMKSRPEVLNGDSSVLSII